MIILKQTKPLEVIYVLFSLSLLGFNWHNLVLFKVNSMVIWFLYKYVQLLP